MVPKFYVVYTVDGLYWESWGLKTYSFVDGLEEVTILKAQFRIARIIAPEIDWKLIPEYDMIKYHTN